MKAYKRDITICILTALVTLSAVGYFLGDMKKVKHLAEIDLYTLISPNAHAVLAINRPSSFTRLMLAKKSVYDAFASKILEVYLSIIQKSPSLPSILLSFHPQGTVLYTKATESQVQMIEKEILEPSSGSFAPQKQSKGGITFTYYPDSGNRFFGSYYHEGVWVASYSKKLLEEAARLQLNKTHRTQEEQPWERATLDTNAPLNLLLQIGQLDLSSSPDSTLQQPDQHQWIEADLFTNDQNICFFSRLPYQETADTTDSTGFSPEAISLKLEELFPQFHLTITTRREKAMTFYTGCSPI